MSNRRTEIERAAAKFRKMYDIDTFGISDIFEVCNSDYYLIRYPIGTDSIMGAAMIKNGDKIIFSNSSLILSREIFTVAHELGHFALGHVNNSNSTHQDITLDEKSQEEQDANYFAVCFLLPEDKLQEFLKIRLKYNTNFHWSTLEIAAVMTAFHVSFETVINRLNYLGYITNEQLADLQQQKKDKSVSAVLRTLGASTDLCFPQNTKRIPLDYLHWVIDNYRSGVISSDVLEKALSFCGDISADDLGIVPVKEDDSFDLDAFLDDTK